MDPLEFNRALDRIKAEPVPPGEMAWVLGTLRHFIDTLSAAVAGDEADGVGAADLAPFRAALAAAGRAEAAVEYVRDTGEGRWRAADLVGEWLKLSRALPAR